MSSVNAPNVRGFKLCFSDTPPLIAECAFDRWIMNGSWTDPRFMIPIVDITDEPEPFLTHLWDRVTYIKARIMFEFGLMLIRFSDR